jgi:ketosteroid isomerase-like protein
VEEARRDAGVTSDADRIRALSDAIEARDWTAVSELVHPEIVWEHNIGVGTPEEGVYEGRETVLELFDRITAPWEELRSVQLDVEDLGEGVFQIEGELRARYEESANEIVTPYKQRFEFRDGLLVKGAMVQGAGAGLPPDGPQEDG